jgi:uncharacterized protein YutE (UPF0331/DUF86 family)
MLDLIERYARTVKRGELDTDRETWLKVKGALEVAAQCTIDLALEIVTRRALGTPQTYREAFGLLGRAGVIEPALAAELEKWAGLRNVLVHVYTTLDLDRVHEALSRTDALRRFETAAARELRTT